ncbi:glutathione S-transferase protein [Necator americanus]|uniref:Glutathione S-transferase protein n=1 Tax=Necator americanus TaxID=51031 RepID=W2SXP8_NECAM|nr:glutathione S-transferase protein [Necator americanus]ETN73661.1 glutathione S-transferase protein [Necator americanus]
MCEKLELISLKGRGRAEAVRLMLVFADHPFTDSRLTIAEWKLRKRKGELTGKKMVYRRMKFYSKNDNFSEDTKLPVMIVNNSSRIVGVNEISKYVAEKLGLYGSLPGEKKAIDDVMTILEELHTGLAPIIRATLTKNYEERRVVWNTFKDSTLFPCLRKFEEELSEKILLVGTRISWADIALIEMLTRLQSCYDSFYMAHFPALKAYCIRFETLPNVRPYIQTRPETHF